tara:strand:- start:1561 stop:2328 length:768 start_codon:yes stop_codon:yes gene_type:complete
MTGEWELALEQSPDLEAVSGSASRVADAVRRGADLRLFMEARGYDETLCFQQVYSGYGDRFAGLMSHHHSYAHRGDLAPQPYFSFFRYDTGGAYSHVKWMLDGSVFHEQQQYAYGVYRWYVCDRWRVVYEHDAEGNRVEGDLGELHQLIRAGRTLKVGVRQFHGLANDDVSGPEQVSFLSVMQPLIAEGHAGANCDFVLDSLPGWPLEFAEGLSLGMVWPDTSGRIVCHLVEPGALPFRRTEIRRGMQWLVAEVG